MAPSSLRRAPTAAASLSTALRAGVALVKQKVAADARGEATSLDPRDQRALDGAMATIEAGYLAVAADGEVTERELDALLGNLRVLLGEGLTRGELAHVIDELEASLDGDGLDARVSAVCRALAPEERRRAFSLACVVSLCDGESEDDELDVLGRLAEALGFSEDDANATFNELADQLDEAL